MYSKYPKNIMYDNKGKDRDFNIFTEEFLGGADTFIYINGERCKDISAVQYSIREQKQPIYSYASRRFNDVASGIRIVKGMLKVPVRNTTYNENLNVQNTGSRSIDNIQIQNQPPSWVYSYSPEKESNAILPQSSSAVYDIQSELRNEGHILDLNGRMDAKTKIAIAKSQRDSGEIITLNSNNDFNKYGSCNKNTYLRIMPNIKSQYIANIDKNETVYILNEVKEFYLIIYKELEGYVPKEEVNIC